MCVPFVHISRHALSDNYRSCLARANRALSTTSFSAATLALIEEDILDTLPNLHIFHPKTGPLYQDLKNILCAWTIARADEGLAYVRTILDLPLHISPHPPTPMH